MKLAPILLALGGLVSSLWAQDPLLIEWPKRPGPRARALANLGTSLVSIQKRDRLATLEELLNQAPFRNDGQRVALDLATLDAVSQKAFADLKKSPVPIPDYRRIASQRYFALREFPKTLPELRIAWDLSNESIWSSVRVRSVIARSVRRIWFPRQVVLQAAQAQGLDPMYPPGTLFVAEELDEHGEVEEVHVMRRRVDHAWDFALYDKSGPRRIASLKRPKRFHAPFSCQGCHQAPRRMPPFSDFPDPSKSFSGFTPKILESFTPAEVRWMRTKKPSPSEYPKGSGVLGNYVGLAQVFENRLSGTNRNTPNK